jgi:hypothetical protein
MVKTVNELPITTRLTNFLVYLWGLIYLFFASIFSDPSKRMVDRQNPQFRPSSGGRNMNGLKKGGCGPAMGG